MIGERLFSYASFGIDPASDGARDRLYEAVFAERNAVRQSPEARSNKIKVLGVWPRGDDLYFEIVPTSLYENEAEEQAAQTPLPGL